jgi:CarboxypepD_reg-like domain/TonB-dependent Receptor Plug Domain
LNIELLLLNLEGNKWSMTRIIIIFLFAVLLLFSVNPVQAQNPDSTRQNIKFSPFEIVINQLESKYSIRFFYDPALLEGREIDSRIAELPLDEALDILKNITQLSISRVSDSYYVFVPTSSTSTDLESDEGKYVVVGDMLNYGSKNKITVQGTVLNGNNNQTLPGVVITFRRLSKPITTDATGKFSVVLPVGENEMKLSYSGFQDCIKTLKVLSDGEITIELFDKVVNINEVVVAANKIDQNFRRTQMSIMKLQAKNIKELPTTLGEVDVVKSLSLMPGIQTMGEFGSGFNVRGGGSDQNLILIEDVPIFNSSHLFGLTSILNSDAINNVTLYKGGIPASYGERVSSVLNVNLGEDNLKKVEVKAGVSLINSRLNVAIPIGSKLTLMVGGRTTYSDWMLRSIPDVDLMNSSASFNDLYGLLSYTPNQKNKLTLFVYDSNDKFSFAGTENYAYSNLLGSLKYTHHFSNNLFTSIMVGSSYYKASYTEKDTLTPLESYSITNSILYRSMKWNLIWQINDKHVITGGINGFLYNVNPGTMSPYGDQSIVPFQSMQAEQGIEWAGFLSDDFKMNEKTSCEFGIRFSSFSDLGPRQVWLYDPLLPKSTESVVDSMNYKKGKTVKTYAGLEPRISLRFNLSEVSSLRISYNRINQYINLISNTSVQTPSSIWKLSDTYIKPVISDQFALGYFRDMLNNKYEASIEVYYKLYKNLIEYKNGASVLLDPQIETQLIDAVGKSYGVELYLKKNTGKLTGWLSYTYSRSFRKTNSDFPVEQINNNNYFPDDLDRPHNLVVNSGYYLTRRLRFGLTYTYTTGRPVTLPEMKYDVDGYQVVYYSDKNKYRMPDYERLDVSVSRYENLRIKKKWKGYWTLSVINVLGRRNAYSIFYQKDTSPTSSEGTYNLYKLYIIGFPLPTLTYNILF